MSIPLNAPSSDHLSDSGNISDYDLCDTVLSTDLLKPGSGEDPKVVKCSADGDKAAAPTTHQADGGALQAANGETEDGSAEANAKLKEAVKESAETKAGVEEAESQLPVVSPPLPTPCSAAPVPVITLNQWPGSAKAEEAFVGLLAALFPTYFSSDDPDDLRREIGMGPDLFDGVVVVRDITPAADMTTSTVVMIDVNIHQLMCKVLEECAIAVSSQKYRNIVEVMAIALVLFPKCTTLMYQMAAAIAKLVSLRQQQVSDALEEVSEIDVTHASVIHYLQLAFDNGEKYLIDRVCDDCDFEVLRDTDRLKAFIVGAEGEKVAALKAAFPSSSVAVIKSALAESGDDATVAASNL